jgi:hypothetical protein
MAYAGLKAPPGLNLIAVTASMFLILVVLGRGILGKPLGALINDQNVMSLSRLQLAVWTVVVGASYFTYAAVRIHVGATDPLNVEIDWHLWALMGISTTSFVGTSLIHDQKQDTDPEATVVEKTAGATGENKADVDYNSQGLLYVNPSKEDARFTDIFQGDELGNTTHIDLGKVQMFFFTLISALVFLAVVYKSLRNPASGLASLPVLPEGLLAILGISHAGFLANQGINHTPTA